MHLWLYFRHPQKQPLTDKLRAVFGIEMLILSCLVQVSQELFMGKLLLKQIFFNQNSYAVCISDFAWHLVAGTLPLPKNGCYRLFT
jgi:hypothetical protein